MLGPSYPWICMCGAFLCCWKVYLMKIYLVLVAGICRFVTGSKKSWFFLSSSKLIHELEILYVIVNILKCFHEFFWALLRSFTIFKNLPTVAVQFLRGDVFSVRFICLFLLPYQMMEFSYEIYTGCCSHLELVPEFLSWFLMIIWWGIKIGQSGYSRIRTGSVHQICWILFSQMKIAFEPKSFGECSRQVKVVRVIFIDLEDAYVLTGSVLKLSVEIWKFWKAAGIV